jgi:hypothetical protein
MAAIVAFEKIIPANEANRSRGGRPCAYAGRMKFLLVLFSSLFVGSGSRPRP